MQDLLACLCFVQAGLGKLQFVHLLGLCRQVCKLQVCYCYAGLQVAGLLLLCRLGGFVTLKGFVVFFSQSIFLLLYGVLC